MSKITIVSHLSPEEWKASWEAKVVEDSSKAMKDYHKCDCFCGRFWECILRAVLRKMFKDLK